MRPTTTHSGRTTRTCASPYAHFPLAETSPRKVGRPRVVVPRLPAGHVVQFASTRSFIVFFSLLLIPLSCGCVQVAAAWTNITGGDWIEPQFTLTQEPLLILIDDRNSIVTEPTAIRELHKTLSVNFLEFKVNHLVVPFEDVQRLMQTDKKFKRYSIRQVGEKLGAEQVLYIVVERFSLHAEPGAPVFKGEFTVRVKVIATHRDKDVRLWPSEESGKRVSSTTPPTPTDSDKTATDIATELGIKLGKEIAAFFYGHREFQK